MYVNEVCFMENKIKENRKHVLLWLYNLNFFMKNEITLEQQAE